MVKIAISAVAGAMLAAGALAVAGTAASLGLALTAPLWVVILGGAALAIAVGATLNYIDNEFGVTERLQEAVRSIEPVSRHGDSIRW